MTAAPEDRAQMSTSDINDLPDSAFAYIEPGGSKDEDGKTAPRSLRHFPVHDEAHCRNALARASQSPFGEKAMPKIRAAAKRYGIEMADRSDESGEYCRAVPDICVRAFDFETKATSSDGRTLEGYVAVFGSVARVSDSKGDFEEEIHRGAFDRSLSRSMPVMQFEHGRDPRVGALPIGVYEVFEPDHKGYFVRGRLLDDPVVEPIRKAIEARALKGMSWRMQVPEAGQKWTRRPGRYDKRDVLDADVPEAGPVVFPAYPATTVGVRSLLAAMDDEEIRSLVRELAAHLGLATDLSDLSGRPNARSVGGAEEPGDQPTEVREAPPLSSVDLSLQEQALRVMGVLPNVR